MSQASLQVLVFSLAGQRYGLLANQVQEVVRAVAIVALPKAPAVVEGVINLRGRLVPVFDLRHRFRLPRKILDPADHFLIVRSGDRLAGLRADQAMELTNLDSNLVEDPQQVVPGAEYVTWIAKLPESLVLIHDVQTFLSREEAELLDSALQSVAEQGPRP